MAVSFQNVKLPDYADNTPTDYRTAPGDANVTETQYVEDRLPGLLDPNSKLNVAAATNAKQDANRSGLLNSTMAVQAGQQAVIDSAFRIASQDATIAANVNLSDQAFRQGQATSLQNYGQTGELQSQTLQNQAAIASNLSRDDTRRLNLQIEANVGASALEQSAALERLETQLSSTETVSSNQLTQDRFTFTEQLSQDLSIEEARIAQSEFQAILNDDTRNYIADLQLSDSQARLLQSSLQAINADATARFTAILANGDLDATTRTAYLNSLAANIQQQRDDLRITQDAELTEWEGTTTTAVGGELGAGILSNYELYLGRTASPSEVAYWINTGLDAGQILTAIENSIEAGNYTAAGTQTTTAGTQTATATADGLYADIISNYSTYLGRAASQSELEYWINTGLDAAEILNHIEGSIEAGNYTA